MWLLRMPLGKAADEQECRGRERETLDAHGVGLFAAKGDWTLVIDGPGLGISRSRRIQISLCAKPHGRDHRAKVQPAKIVSPDEELAFFRPNQTVSDKLEVWAPISVALNSLINPACKFGPKEL